MLGNAGLSVVPVSVHSIIRVLAYGVCNKKSCGLGGSDDRQELSGLFGMPGGQDESPPLGWSG